jgi:hypothetical protein
VTTYSHEFEDEEGNDTELTDITYVVLATYVQPDPEDEDAIVFTHVVRIRPESLDMELAMMNLTKEDVENAMNGVEAEGGTRDASL